ncbi:MAG: VWD domain-containing protein [Myxococcales bacterium]|nr:VWD domain-containing protein [Myxococcales bacterium]
MTVHGTLGAGALLLVASLSECFLWPEPPPPPPRPEPVEPKPPQPPPQPPASPCPSPDVDDVVQDPKVREAMDEAWRRSEEGTDGEHEESFWVIQRRNVHAKPATYDTFIKWDKEGTVDSGGGSSKPQISGGRVVMHFHTHPGPGGEIRDERYANDEASPDDIAAQDGVGVPMVIRYGQGSDPGGTVDMRFDLSDGTRLDRSRSLQWECPDPPPPAPPPPPGGPPTCQGCARSTGDPHLETHDGRTYDLQAAGEFVAVAVDGESRVQLRMQPTDASRVVSINTAVGLRVGAARLSIRPGVGLRVDGAAVELTPADIGVARQHRIVTVGGAPTVREPQRLALAGGGSIARHGEDYVVDWPDGARAWVQVLDRSLDVFFAAPEALRGRTSGLLGSHDGDPGNDFTLRDGEVLVDPDHATLHGRFADGWRVRPGESLFDYGPGESSEGFTDRGMPAAPSTLDALDPEARRAAAAACAAAGVHEPVALAECTLDFAVARDPAFIRSAQALQTLDDPRPGLHPTRAAGRAQASAGPRYRVRYTVRQDGGDSEFTLVVDPPREAIVMANTRTVMDGRRLMTCVEVGGPAQCWTQEEGAPLDPFSGFARTETPDSLRAWLTTGSGGPERHEPRTIAGRRAACKLTEENAVTSAVCHDLETGVLLSASLVTAGQRVFEFEAAEFGRPREADFQPPPGATVLPSPP